MKKVIALVLIIAIALSVVISASADRVRYDTNKDIFVVVAADDNGVTYTATLQRKAVEKLIKANALYDLYLLECDSLVPLDWNIMNENQIVITSKITGEVL